MIRVENLTAHAGTFTITNVSFEVPTGQYGILMGRTGTGKTTILESLCGLKQVAAGKIVLMGRDVTRCKPAERGIGFVPQDGALFPTMTVFEQIAFALVVRGWKKAKQRERVEELAEMLGIEDLLKRSVTGLSGGERQRIALGRALAPSPDVLCLDEPLSALDESTREEMYALLMKVQQCTGVTALHITHSKSEARLLGDVVFQIEDGRVMPLTQKLPAKSAGGNGNGQQASVPTTVPAETP